MKTCICLLLEGETTEKEQTKMLDRLRSHALEEIYFKEKTK